MDKITANVNKSVDQKSPINGSELSAVSAAVSTTSKDEHSASSTSKDGNAESAEELFCICRQPYNENEFYIGCEKCNDWYVEG